MAGLGWAVFEMEAAEEEEGPRVRSEEKAVELAKIEE